MINKYYNDVIEQVYNKVGKTKNNIVMACYSNDFSIHYLDTIRRFNENTDGVYFAWHEYLYDEAPDPFAPFLNVICDMHRKYIGGDFADFLEECNVYQLQRCIFTSYYETGVCKREESLILKEVDFERRCMSNAMASMMKKMAQVRPIVIVINRFHLAAESTIKLVNMLIEEPSTNIGIVLGTNDGRFQQDDMRELWKCTLELLDNNNLRYHIGSSGLSRMDDDNSGAFNMEMSVALKQINNMMELMDYNLAKNFLILLDRQIKYEEIDICEGEKLEFYLRYVQVSVWRGEMSKALEIIESIRHLRIPGKEHEIIYQCAFWTATCYMYQNKLPEAQTYAKKARIEAEKRGTEEEVFRAELLMAQAKMSGWHNIFFCMQNIPIEDSLLEKLHKFNYINHLAYIYIFAYDNGRQSIEKVYRSEDELVYYQKGVALARQINNYSLLSAAYVKNHMTAATEGMYEIAIYFINKTYELEKEIALPLDARILSAIGYNLSALSHNEKANLYYAKAIQVFYQDRKPEEIAEVYYNRGMNQIMIGKYKAAEHDFQMALKIIEYLHLNSLRVCNLSKLYGLLALCCILEGERFNCERYLTNCRQFLNYVMERERKREAEKTEMIHDYTKCDDDMFLYHFATALLHMLNQENEEAFEHMNQAEIFLERAEGTQFFAYVLFRLKRMALFDRLGMKNQSEQQRALLNKRLEENRKLEENFHTEWLVHLDQEVDGIQVVVSEREMEILFKQEGLAKDYMTSKRQIDFLSTWQKCLDVVNVEVPEMVEDALRMFQNYFSLDQCVYIWYEDNHPTVLYDNTGVSFNSKIFYIIEQSVKEYPHGFVVSKIRDDFFEHQDVISIFGLDNVCSFAAVPFYKNGRLSSLVITYIMMKDNWHSSIERYMLNENDLRMYQLLFRELSSSIHRLDASNKVQEMNRQLQAAAVTDLLTGIYNRTGMYQEIAKMTEQIPLRGGGIPVGLMFIDLDNFKPYNDTFGHDIGDIILREMAAIFKRASEGKGFVSRFGGDEFIIILNTDVKIELEYIVKDIYAEIASANGFKRQIERYLGHEIEVSSQNKVTCSIGISTASKVKTEEEFNELIKQADDMLYKVKKMEKGHYAFI